MNKRNILGRTSSAFSAKINKPDKSNPFGLQRSQTKRVPHPVRVPPPPPPPPAHEPVLEEQEELEESTVLQPTIEEDIISIKAGESVLYRSGFDPNHIRFVQILKEKRIFSESETLQEFPLKPSSTEGTLELVENYSIEFIDPYITKITAGQDITDCIIRIYFCEPTLVGVLEKVEGTEKEAYDDKIIEWDMGGEGGVFTQEQWEEEIDKLDIGEPFIKGIYSSKKFSFVIKDKDGIEYTFQNENVV